jgi:hypothetical protein
VNIEADNEEDVVHVHEENAQQLLQATHMREALGEYLGRQRNLL